MIIEREDDWWLADVPAEQGVHTEGRDMPELEYMVRDVLCLALDLPITAEAMAALELEWVFETGDAEFDALATRLAAERAAVDVPDERTRAVAADLGAQGWPVRDIAWLLGVSPRRVGRWVPRSARGVARIAR